MRFRSRETTLTISWKWVAKLLGYTGHMGESLEEVIVLLGTGPFSSMCERCFWIWRSESDQKVRVCGGCMFLSAGSAKLSLGTAFPRDCSLLMCMGFKYMYNCTVIANSFNLHWNTKCSFLPTRTPLVLFCHVVCTKWRSRTILDFAFCDELWKH